MSSPFPLFNQVIVGCYGMNLIVLHVDVVDKYFVVI